MNDQALLQIAQAINNLSGKVLALNVAMEEVIRRLPESERKEMSERLRSNMDEALSLHPGAGNMDMESSATLQLAALLEAAGFPPQR